MCTYPNRIFVFVVLAFAFTVAAPSAKANLLVDPGFENNPLLSYSLVLNNFAAYQGRWGVEMASITGAQGGVTPDEGVKMLRMTDDELVVTQAFQVTDVTSYATLIDNGNGVIDLSARMNVDSGVAAAMGAVVIQFFSSAVYSSEISHISNGLTLDTLPGTWETDSVSGAIPVGTRWVASQVSYNDDSIGSAPGYVDTTELTITPEPATLSVLALGGLALIRRRRK